MAFNSIEFALFLSIVFIIYWKLQRYLTIQNVFIVGVSYLFYGWWDWRFLILIFITSLSSFLTGLMINRDTKPSSRLWLTVNITLNLLILCTFKYFNFFSENLAQLFNLFGYQLDWFTLDILLPVGISFYTFQAISYSIDVYRKKIEPTKNIVAFFAYIAFFPQLVAGPIEKATNLLPQFLKKRQFDYDNAVVGMRQILWGLVKKIVIADYCAHYVDMIWSNSSDYNSSTLLVVAIAFSFQIYGDFSGYCDIAIGSARLLGIRLLPNFNYPYFSRNIGEFWRRWHISLMAWFRDYIYIPLGGSRRGTKYTIFNILVVFFLSGLWHGANWTFVVWGLFNAVLLIVELLFKVKKTSGNPTYKALPNIILTFILVTIGWIIFRSSSLTEFWCFVSNLCTSTILDKPVLLSPIAYIGVFLIIEWLGRKNEFAIQKLPFRNKIMRWSFYWILLAIIVFANDFESQQFIYFQF